MTVPRSLILATLFASSADVVGAQGIPPIEREFESGAKLRFYGQIDKGVLGYDDGVETETYEAIDNDNSNTRLGLAYTQPFGGWTFENVNEFQYAPYSTSNVNIDDQSPSRSDYDLSNDNIRKIDFTLESDRFGKFWLGQGSMATDGVAEFDLSGTDVIGYSAVQDSAAAQLVRYAERDFAEAFGPEIGDAFTNYNSGRLVRIRYDTPSFGGFTVALALGRDLLVGDESVRELNQYDVALSYETESEDVAAAAGIGYFGDEDDLSTWSGSATALHKPTGLNATFAAGLQASDGEEGGFWYGKLGLLRDFVDWGESAASVDYYAGDDIFTSDGVEVLDSNGDPVLDEDGEPVTGDITTSDSVSWGVSLVQKVDAWNTELWLTYRTYDYADDFARYEDGQAIFGGARFSF